MSAVRGSLIVIAACLWIVATAIVRAEGPQASPSWDWAVASPESQGMDPAALESAWAVLKDRQTTALLVIRHDRIVFERYATGHGRTTPHGTASLAKALVGGVGLMVAMGDGRIKPDDPAHRYVPRWRDDPERKAITVRHLATHTSGIEDAEADGLPHDRLTGWKGDFWKRLPPPLDPFTLARDRAPVLEVPGTRTRYSNPGMAMLGYCVTASLRGSGDADLRSLLKRRIMGPLGVPDAEWSVGYGIDDDRGRPAPGGDLGRRLVQPERRGQGRSAPPEPGDVGRPSDCSTRRSWRRPSSPAGCRDIRGWAGG